MHNIRRAKYSAYTLYSILNTEHLGSVVHIQCCTRSKYNMHNGTVHAHSTVYSRSGNICAP